MADDKALWREILPINPDRTSEAETIVENMSVKSTVLPKLHRLTTAQPLEASMMPQLHGKVETPLTPISHPITSTTHGAKVRKVSTSLKLMQKMKNDEGIDDESSICT